MQEISFRSISERAEALSDDGKESQLPTQQSLFSTPPGSRAHMRHTGNNEHDAEPSFLLFAFFYDVTIYFVSLLVRWAKMFGRFVDVYGDYSIVLKRFMLKKLFWGRGSTFQFTTQFLFVLMSGFVLIAMLYRGSTALEASVSAHDAQVDRVAQNPVDTDLFVQGVPTTTAKAQRLGIQYDEYIVKRGDTLSTIAEAYDLSQSTLMWANNLQSTFLRPGMKLKIPPGDGVMVKVGKNDTVDSIAKKYHGHAESIIEANVLDYPFTLKEGEEIFCPECKMPEPPKPVVAQRPTASSNIIHTKPSAPISVPTTASGGSVGRFVHWPVAGGAVSRCFTGYHPAIDIADRSLPNLLAAADGTVIFAGCQSGSCPALSPGKLARGGIGLAWMVEIQHDNGYKTAYGHMNRIDVVPGQRVKQGQVIGQMGSSGYSTGPHLHFVLLPPGVTNLLGGVNPAPYMTQTGGCR